MRIKRRTIEGCRKVNYEIIKHPKIAYISIFVYVIRFLADPPYLSE